MRTLRTICAYLIIGLGMTHIALTAHATGQWVSPRALFFAGAGVAIVLLGAVNLIMNRADDDAYVRAIGTRSSARSCCRDLGHYFPSRAHGDRHVSDRRFPKLEIRWSLGRSRLN